MPRHRQAPASLVRATAVGGTPDDRDRVGRLCAPAQQQSETRRQPSGRCAGVVMTGDSFSDAPALRAVTVGVAGVRACGDARSKIVCSSVVCQRLTTPGFTELKW